MKADIKLSFLFTDIIFDSKLAILDLYTALDTNKDTIVSIHELILGIINLTESIGIKIKPEMKQILLNIADIIQVDKSVDVELPKGKFLNRLKFSYS